MYYKQVENGIILSIGTLEVANDSLTEITEIEYNNLLEVIVNKPDDTLEHIYRLSAERNQYEPFERTHDETVDWYVDKVLSEEMHIDEVPEAYKEEVQSKLPKPEEPKYTLDEAAALIASEVSE